MRNTAIDNSGKASKRRRPLWLALGIAVLVVAILGVIGLLLTDQLVNRFAKPRIERALAASGTQLRLGTLRYSWWKNRITSDTAEVASGKVSVSARRLSLAGVRWIKLLSRRDSIIDVVSAAEADAADVVVRIAQSEYEIHCAQVSGSLHGGKLRLERIELAPTVSDVVFFGASPFRRTRIRLQVDACRLSGISVGSLKHVNGGRVNEILVERPVFEALVSREKPRKPVENPPLMLHEALAALPAGLRVETLLLTNGLVRYSERRAPQLEPGLLTISDIAISGRGFVTGAPTGTVANIDAHGRLMDAGLLTVKMQVPLDHPDFFLTYSGSLEPMKLERLNGFLEGAEFLRIKSGETEGVSFDVRVAAGHATGYVRGIYRDLKVATLDHDTGRESGFVNRLTSWLTNALKIRNENLPDATGVVRAGKVEHQRQRADTFISFTWFALRSGLLDTISL